MSKSSTDRTLPKWQIVENVVAAIQRVRGNAASWRIHQKAMLRERNTNVEREVDIYVECPSADWCFRCAIDVKDEKDPIDLVMMEQLCAKARKLDVDRYVVVATSGYTEAALGEAKQNGVQAQTLKSLDAAAVLTLDCVTWPTYDITNVVLVYEDGRERPPREELPTTWFEDSNACVRLDQLAKNCLLENRAILVEGDGAHGLQVNDDNRVWQRLHSAGREWPPPFGMIIEYNAVVQHVSGQKYVTDDGREAFTVQLPLSDDRSLRQVTIVATPRMDSGADLAVSVGEIRPKRKRVS